MRRLILRHLRVRVHNICGPGLQFCLLSAAFPRFRGRWWLQAAGRCDYDYTGQARPWGHILGTVTIVIMGVYDENFKFYIGRICNIFH